VSTATAVIFGLDGVLIDSETVWGRDPARARAPERRDLERGSDAGDDGMSSVERSRSMRDELGVPMTTDEISTSVLAGLERRYRERLPLIPGALAAVARLAERWPLGLASSANRPIIELVLRESGLTRRFQATVSAKEVPRGKPAPDVHMEAARRLAADPARYVAIEDFANGLRAAAAARTDAIGIPNRAFPPDPDALALALADDEQDRRSRLLRPDDCMARPWSISYEEPPAARLHAVTLKRCKSSQRGLYGGAS
jgi:HAD superfamily hydrolase (TIGR01509 family)